MINLINNIKFLPLFIKKIFIFYIFFAKKSLQVTLKLIQSSIHVVSTKLYFLYFCISFLGICDKSFATNLNFCFFLAAFQFVIFSALSTVLFNNKFFSSKIEYFLGQDFCKTYVIREIGGYYYKPFLYITVTFFSIFFFDIFTCMVDHQALLVKVKNLAIQQSILYKEGDILKGREIVKEIVVLTKYPSTGIVTKSNIIINWFIFKIFS